jgi:hypothetical protein
VRYSLKIFYLPADKNDAPDDCEIESTSENGWDWVSSFATDRGSQDPVLILRMKASWSSRG